MDKGWNSFRNWVYPRDRSYVDDDFEGDQADMRPGYWRRGRSLRDNHSWLFVAIVAAIVFGVGGCEAEPGPSPQTLEYEEESLAAPFDALIPDAALASSALLAFDGMTISKTKYGSDGSVLHWRSMESADETVLLSMTIKEHGTYRDALAYLRERQHSEFCDEVDILYWSGWLDLSPSEVAYRLMFFREPGVGVQGEETIYFCMDGNVAEYKLWVMSPPKLGDGHIMPKICTDALMSAARHTLRVWGHGAESVE